MPPDSELDSAIRNAYAEGQKRFGDLGLELQTFAARINFIINKYLGLSHSETEAINFAGNLHAADLYLTTACAQHSPGAAAWNQQGDPAGDTSVAWRALEKTYKAFICDLVRFFHRKSFAAQDLAENVLADLFLPDRSGTSRIASYEGRSALSTWLRVIIWNRAINTQRSWTYSKTTEMETEIVDEPALRNLETAIKAQRYNTALQDALVSACLELTHQQRLILLWRYEQELQLGQIAKLLGIHQSTVTRQLEKMQAKLRQRVTAILMQKHGLSQPSIQECFEEVTGTLRQTISILDFIRNPPETRQDAAPSSAAEAG